MVQLVAGVSEVLGYVEVTLGEPVEVAKGQHPWDKAGQVVHFGTETTVVGGVELC